MKTTNIKVEANENPNHPDTDSYTIEVIGMPIWAKLHFKKSFGKDRNEVSVTPDEFEMNIHAKDVDDFAPEVLKEMSREINKELRDMNDMSSPDVGLSKSDKVQKAFSKAFETRNWDDFIESQKPEYASEADSRDASGEGIEDENTKMQILGFLTVAVAGLITLNANAGKVIASSPGFVGAVSKSFITGFADNIERVKAMPIWPEFANSKIVQGTLLGIVPEDKVTVKTIKGSVKKFKDSLKPS